MKKTFYLLEIKFFFVFKIGIYIFQNKNLYSEMYATIKFLNIFFSMYLTLSRRPFYLCCSPNNTYAL